MLEQARVLEADDPGLVAADAARLAPRLLVIDDDHLHCTIICRVATRAGFAPVGAATYEAAAKLAQETTFDGMTLDLSLKRDDFRFVHSLSLRSSWRIRLG